MRNKLIILFFSLSLLTNFIAGCKNYEAPQDVDQTNRELPPASDALTLDGMGMPESKEEAQEDKQNNPFTTPKNEETKNSTAKTNSNHEGIASDKKSSLEKDESEENLNETKKGTDDDSLPSRPKNTRTPSSQTENKNGLEKDKDLEAKPEKSNGKFKVPKFLRKIFGGGEKDEEQCKEANKNQGDGKGIKKNHSALNVVATETGEVKDENSADLRRIQSETDIAKGEAGNKKKSRNNKKNKSSQYQGMAPKDQAPTPGEQKEQVFNGNLSSKEKEKPSAEKLRSAPTSRETSPRKRWSLFNKTVKQEGAQDLGEEDASTSSLKEDLFSQDEDAEQPGSEEKVPVDQKKSQFGWRGFKILESMKAKSTGSLLNLSESRKVEIIETEESGLNSAPASPISPRRQKDILEGEEEAREDFEVEEGSVMSGKVSENKKANKPYKGKSEDAGSKVKKSEKKEESRRRSKSRQQIEGERLGQEGKSAESVEHATDSKGDRKNVKKEKSEKKSSKKSSSKLKASKKVKRKRNGSDEAQDKDTQEGEKVDNGAKKEKKKHTDKSKKDKKEKKQDKRRRSKEVGK